ncbi:hypothetical protein OJ998_07495 [Solirubrobacter taibaiensis]|nr:hypothetical protein [Solirubrobacter taibaiensis]
MRVPTTIVALIASVATVLATPAFGQSEEDFTPVGYEFCGWLNLGEGTWTYGDPEDGAWLRLFARDMTCRSARRNYGRVRYTQRPPYRPVKPGYRCRTLDSDYEYGDVRCAKQGKSRVAFRWQTGS